MRSVLRFSSILNRLEDGNSAMAPQQMQTNASGRLFSTGMAATARPLFGRPINLQPSGAQPRHPIKVEVALPGEEFIDRDLVVVADLLDWSPSTTNCLDDGGFAADGPSRRRL